MKNNKLILCLIVPMVLSGCQTIEIDQYDAKAKMDNVTESTALSSDDILDSFLNNEIAADGSTFGMNSFKLSDLEMKDDESADGYTIGDRVDLDNDGENELILNDIYGGMYLDARDHGLYVLALGDGTAAYLDYINYDNATWILYSDTMHTDRISYRMEKYQGGDHLIDTLSLSRETDNNLTKFYMNGEEVDYQKFYETYDSVFPAPAAVEGSDFSSTATIDSDDFPSPITEEEFASFQGNSDIQVESGFDDFDSILAQDYLGTWYNPDWNEAIRLTSMGAYVYYPDDTSYSTTLYPYEIIDRSDRGLCPELLIEGDNERFFGAAYYIARYTEGCFYGSDGYFIFYKQ